MSYHTVIPSASEMRSKTKIAQQSIEANKEAEKRARVDRLKEVVWKAINQGATSGKYTATCEILDEEAKDGALDQIFDLLLTEGYTVRTTDRVAPYRQPFEISWS